jgi:hypothetical protein
MKDINRRRSLPMTRKYGRFFLLTLFVLALPLSSWAFGVDLTVHAGGGAAMGSTDDDNKTGKIGFAAGGGAGIDLALLDLNPLGLGLSTGAEYIYLKYESEVFIDAGILGTTDLSATTDYGYITVPLTLQASLPLNEKLTLRFSAGGFAGFFLGGTADNDYNPEIAPAGLLDEKVDLDDSEIEAWQYGLRFGTAVEIKSRGKIHLEPGLLFDLGLTDTTITQPSRDTFWALTAYVGCRYSLF